MDSICRPDFPVDQYEQLLVEGNLLMNALAVRDSSAALDAHNGIMAAAGTLGLPSWFRQWIAPLVDAASKYDIDGMRDGYKRLETFEGIDDDPATQTEKVIGGESSSINPKPKRKRPDWTAVKGRVMELMQEQPECAGWSDSHWARELGVSRQSLFDRRASEKAKKVAALIRAHTTSVAARPEVTVAVNRCQKDHANRQWG